MSRIRTALFVTSVLGVASVAPHSNALEAVNFDLATASKGLAETLQNTSLVETARREGRTDPQELFGAAQADYGRLLGALYAAGHYSGVISIRIDGQEAAGIAPLNAPRQIRRIDISVQPGAPFTFARAEVGPLAPGTEIPPEFAAGQPALSGTIRQAAETAVDGWRDVGHAKARVGAQSLVADHPRAVIDARLQIAPGPAVRFGKLTFTGQNRMRLARLYKIAGLKEGEVYSPQELRLAADRLRRTGVFRSVALTESETLGPGNTVDITANVSEMPWRRLGAGAELTSTEGGSASVYWLHRNLMGGAERFQAELGVSRLGMAGGMDWNLGITVERPASFTPDTTAKLAIGFKRISDDDSNTELVELGFGLRHLFSDSLTGRADLIYTISRTTDVNGKRVFRNLSLPLGATWDRRDTPLDTRKGYWIDAELRPFKGFRTTGSGVRGKFDARGYYPLGERAVFAARVQGGIIRGSDLQDTPRDYLFWSGGGGTVRGQPFKSLGVEVGGVTTGGTRHIGGSVELRGKVTDKIGVVGFFDYGSITDARFSAAPDSNWHAGAGLGVRYATPVGPIRLDVAAPAGGRKGDGMQFYIGIGQSF